MYVYIEHMATSGLSVCHVHMVPYLLGLNGNGLARVRDMYPERVATERERESEWVRERVNELAILREKLVRD